MQSCNNIVVFRLTEQRLDGDSVEGSLGEGLPLDTHAGAAHLVRTQVLHTQTHWTERETERETVSE